jgi:hypothetical protein
LAFNASEVPAADNGNGSDDLVWFDDDDEEDYFLKLLLLLWCRVRMMN